MIEFDDLTEDEQKAIRSLQRLADRWPRTLMLYGRSGSLEVHHVDNQPCNEAEPLERIFNIIGDGGDT